jgi:hypothetical protein
VITAYAEAPEAIFISSLAHIETEYVCCTRGEFVLVLAVNIHSAVWLRAIALCSLF